MTAAIATDAVPADGSQHHDSCMVALRIPEEVGSRVALDGGVPAPEMHITLAYLGKLDDLAPGDSERILTAARKTAADWAPLSGQFPQGWGVFSNGGDGQPLWVHPDVPGVSTMREDLVNNLSSEGVGERVSSDHSFTPHVTLAYLQEGDTLPIDLLNQNTAQSYDVQFPDLMVSIGDDTVYVPFSGSQIALTAAADAPAATAGTTLLTPDTSDVAPIYLALVDDVDKQAVLDVLALVPSTSANSQPIVYSRGPDKTWTLDEPMRTAMLSTTPPPVVRLDADTAKNVIEQVDGFYTRKVQDNSKADSTTPDDGTTAPTPDTDTSTNAALDFDPYTDLQLYSAFGELFPIPTEIELTAGARIEADAELYRTLISSAGRALVEVCPTLSLMDAQQALTSVLRSWAPVDIRGIGQIMPVLADVGVPHPGPSALTAALNIAIAALPSTGRRVQPVLTAADSALTAAACIGSPLAVDVMGNHLQMAQSYAVSDTAQMVDFVVIRNGPVDTLPNSNVRQATNVAGSDAGVTELISLPVPQTASAKIGSVSRDGTVAGVDLHLLSKRDVVDLADLRVSRHEVQSSLVAAVHSVQGEAATERLRRYWTTGKGGAKIRWGEGGDWERCVRHLSKYLGARAKGYCQNLHHRATGIYTSTHAKLIRDATGQGHHHLTGFEPVNDEHQFGVINASLNRAFVASGGLPEIAVTDVAASDAPEHGARFRIPLLVPEGVETGDGRQFVPLSVRTRELPIPLLWQVKTADGHDGSVVVGRIDTIDRVNNGLGNAYGVFDVGPYGREVERLVRGKFLRGVSADLDEFEATASAPNKVVIVTDGEVPADPDLDPDQGAADDSPQFTRIGGEKMLIDRARVTAATVVAKPAFEECVIELLPDEETL